jgi:glycine/D-amino acid oxidase-like deaminating enzyme/nitrite reductase/ring-hydroxylating ferredoxin subunit
MKLPGKSECCWTATAGVTSYARLRHSGRTDVAVVGAGIVGLTAAYLLTRAGLSVTVLEARKVGRQVTGRSTAKVTAQHSLIYRHLIDTIGVEGAQHYAEANRSGIELIRGWVDQLAIDCDFEPKDAYAYTCDPSRRSDIEREAEAARSLGFEADVLAAAPLPFATAGALRFRDQAQFNPVKYLIGLAAAIETAGGHVFENTRVTSVDKGSRWRIEAGRYHLDAEHVVLATNLPIAGSRSFDRIARPRCHIAMAFRMAPGAAIDGMFIGIEDPTHSLRMGRDRDGSLLVVLGPWFITGHDGDVAARFRELEVWVRRNLPAGDVAWHWHNEDYDTADRVPFVGAPSKKEPGLYVATGFNGWGISNGAAAGMLIADQIRGRANPWAALYDPARRARKNNKGGDSQSLVASLKDIRPGEGGVIKLGNGHLAVRKAANGSLRALSAACTHDGCTVTWNNAEQTWDCPCHGSIFSVDGKVIHGPAVDPLPARKLPSNWTKRRSRGTHRAKART